MLFVFMLWYDLVFLEFKNKLLPLVNFNPYRARPGLFRANQANVMADDALAPKNARTSRAMALIMRNSHVAVFLESESQETAMFLNSGMVWDVYDKYVHTLAYKGWMTK